MKTFLHKMKLSFHAIVCGWIACNLALWLGRLPEIIESPAQGGITAVLFYGIFSGAVILAAWLAIFLPVDLLVPDHSPLRRPGPAAVCGFIAGSSVLAVQWGFSAWENDSLHLLLTRHWKGLPFLLSPGITGMVAAHVRSRDRRPAPGRACPLNRVSKACDIFDML